MTNSISSVALLLLAVGALAALPSCSKRDDGSSSSGSRGLNMMNNSDSGAAGSPEAPTSMTMDQNPPVSIPDAALDVNQDGPQDAAADQPYEVARPAPFPVPLVGTRIYDPATPGQGPCTNRTYGDLLAEIKFNAPYLRNAPGASTVREGNINIEGYTSEGGFRIVFDRGAGDCPSGCTEHEKWYYITSQACAPVEIGHCRDMSEARSCDIPSWGRCLLKSKAVDPLYPQHDLDQDLYWNGVDLCPMVPEDELMPHPCDGCPAT